MEPKEYQQRTLDRVKEYLGHLYALKQTYQKALEELGPEASFDFAARAWGKLEGMYRQYTGRRDGLGRPLPAFCLKVPTGGGKTFLAVKAIDLINTIYRKRRTGLVLWVVPTSQIYSQTLKQLRDRDHPYRQHLDIASGGKTLILEKMQGFSPLDTQENLVVMLLMLQSSARQSKETLKVFRDSGNFAEFFPAEDAVEDNQRLLQRVPNLDTFEKAGGFWGRQIKTSLGNTLRLLEPVLIMDEGHKAYSETARSTLEGFNPSILVELSATPPEAGNKLVEITGVELDREQMIKFDLHVINKASVDWKDTLLSSHNHLENLGEKAREYEANSGRHIRPICLIQVERTGKNQRDGKYIHAEDVRERLIETLGVEPDEIAVKTSEKDELKEVDDVGGLMGRDCRIRYIITKQALQEGWDCAFAYVLCILTNPGSQTAMTQLVGRILRQPFAQKTGVRELDESYVFCFHQRGAELMEAIRNGLMGEGLGDLAGRVALGADEGEAAKGSDKMCTVRESFKPSIAQTILPVFVLREGRQWRTVSYHADIESRIGWDEADLSPLQNLTLSTLEEKDIEHIAAISQDAHRVIEQKNAVVLKKGGITVDPVFLSRHLLDIVPNPWEAYGMGQKVLDSLYDKYDGKLVTNNFVFIIEEMHKLLEKEKNRLAEGVFHRLISEGKLRFLVFTNEIGFRLPPQRIVKSEKTLTRKDGRGLQRSLFDYVPEEDFNETEKKVAWYLEEQDRLLWWYRNVPRRDYGVQGWQRHKIYADFIFADAAEAPEQFNRVYVIETKGLHIKNSEDSLYKRSVFQLCNTLGKKMTRSELGEQLNAPNIHFQVIDEEEWQSRLNELFAS
ncbi:MAG: DEAD/DEAH box helicase family protein [Sedimentisphaerales bacterium]|nr:DEAD/DEAH box helicase family protein [Sedimentisphaerales bacterium]